MIKRESLAARLGLLVAVCLFSNAINLLALTSQEDQKKAERPLHFFLGADVTFGGDSLVTMSMTDGSKKDVRAGTIAEIKGGLEFRIVPGVSFRGSIGYHFDEESASLSSEVDGNISFYRFPLEGMLFGHISDNLNLGAGVRKSLGATLEGTDGLAYIGSYSLESSLGFVVEAEYRIQHWGLFLRYVGEKYRYGSNTVWSNGGHIGLGGAYYF